MESVLARESMIYQVLFLIEACTKDAFKLRFCLYT